MTERDTAVIIVNWNGLRFLDDCFHGLAAQTYGRFDIWFVDNGSVDDSLAFARRARPGLRVIRNTENEGFARANNQGIAAAFADPGIRYVVLLNNDTEVAPEWLAELIAEAERHPAAGVIASKILMFDDRTRIDSAGDMIERATLQVVNRGHGERDDGRFDEPREVFAACAAACLFRREALEQAFAAGGDYLDGDLGSYVEDVDLAIRIRLLGWEVRYAPSARVYHVGSGTSAALARAWKHRISVRNRILVVIKDLPPRYAARFVFRYLVPVRDAKRLLARRFSFLPAAWAPPSLETNNFSLLTIASIYFGGVLGAVSLVPKMVRKHMRIARARRVPRAEIARWLRELSV